MKKLIIVILLSINMAYADIIDDMDTKSLECSQSFLKSDVNIVCYRALIFIEENMHKIDNTELTEYKKLQLEGISGTLKTWSLLRSLK